MLNVQRRGFTLVELLVVILIIVILSVSMLPLLQPYVVKAQYAAEVFPVLEVIRQAVSAQWRADAIGRSDSVPNLLTIICPDWPNTDDSTLTFRNDGVDVLNNQTATVHLSTANTALGTTFGVSAKTINGKKFKIHDYQLRIDKWDREKNAMLLTIAAVNKPSGTGCAYLFAQFPGVSNTVPLVAKWERYRATKRTFGTFIRGHVSSTVANSSHVELASVINVPSYEELLNSSSRTKLLKQLGWDEIQTEESPREGIDVKKADFGKLGPRSPDKTL